MLSEVREYHFDQSLAPSYWVATVEWKEAFYISFRFTAADIPAWKGALGFSGKNMPGVPDKLRLGWVPLREQLNIWLDVCQQTSGLFWKEQK